MRKLPHLIFLCPEKRFVSARGGIHKKNGRMISAPAAYMGMFSGENRRKTHDMGRLREILCVLCII